jgi:hypothetical protein
MEGPKFFREKGTFPKEQWTFPEEKHKFPKETYVLNFLETKIISYSFLGLQPIIKKVLRRITTLSLEALQNSYEKVTITQSFKCICSPRNMFVPQGNLGLYFHKGHGCSLGQLRPLFLEGHGCFSGSSMCQRNKGLSCLGEQLCSSENKCVQNLMWL